MRQPVLGVRVEHWQPLDLADIDPVVHDDHAVGVDAVVLEDLADRVGGREKQIDLPVLPLRERMPLQMEIHAA